MKITYTSYHLLCHSRTNKITQKVVGKSHTYLQGGVYFLFQAKNPHGRPRRCIFLGKLVALVQFLCDLHCLGPLVV